MWVVLSGVANAAHSYTLDATRNTQGVSDHGRFRQERKYEYQPATFPEDLGRAVHHQRGLTLAPLA